MFAVEECGLDGCLPLPWAEADQRNTLRRLWSVIVVTALAACSVWCVVQLKLLRHAEGPAAAARLLALDEGAPARRAAPLQAVPPGTAAGRAAGA